MNLLNHLFTYVLFLTVLIVIDAKEKCNMTINDADECARKMMFIGDRDNLVPANDAEMSDYCTRMQNGIRCIRNYARLCLPSFPQQVFGMFAYDAKTVMRNQCRAPKERKEFMHHAACFLPKTFMEPLHLCIDVYNAQLDYISNLDPGWRIPGLCCSFHQLQNSLNVNTDKICKAKTGPETMDYFDDMMNRMTDDVLDFTCGPYKTIEKCAELMDANIWKELNGMTEGDPTRFKDKHRFKSPLPLIVKIITDYNM